MTRIEQLELIKEVFDRLDRVVGDTIDEKISNALYNVNVDIMECFTNKKQEEYLKYTKKLIDRYK